MRNQNFDDIVFNKTSHISNVLKVITTLSWKIVNSVRSSSGIVYNISESFTRLLLTQPIMVKLLLHLVKQQKDKLCTSIGHILIDYGILDFMNNNFFTHPDESDDDNWNWKEAIPAFLKSLQVIQIEEMALAIMNTESIYI